MSPTCSRRWVVFWFGARHEAGAVSPLLCHAYRRRHASVTRTKLQPRAQGVPLAEWGSCPGSENALISITL